MTTEARPSYLASPEASQAIALLHRATQDALGGVVGQPVTVSLNERRAVAPGDLDQSSKNVLVEVQFERPLEVHHSIVILANGAELIDMFGLTPPDDETEILGAESLLSLGDIVSTFLDTLAGELLWLQPTPRAWLANLEPVAVDASGGSHIALPALVAEQSPQYLAEVVVDNGSATCTMHLIFGELTEMTLLAVEGVGSVPAPPVEAPAPAPARPARPAPEPAPAPLAAEVPQATEGPVRDEAAPARVQAPVQPAHFKPLGPEQTVGRSNSIDLIRDVPLHVSVELGRASLTVREILALGVGSVVELDRLAGEPVDVLVNDRLIGRGEVVIVDESFGVRLTEIFRESSKRGGQ